MSKIKSIRYHLALLFLVGINIQIFSQNLEKIQRDYTDLRFGAFFHFGIRTFTGGNWGEANQDVSKFNPVSLDCGQWADALIAANMKFGILTTKHHDGFCLWDSEYTTHDVASSPWKDGKGDVLREYVDSFRIRGLEPSFYYSIWDNTAGIGNGSITNSDMEVIKGELTDILSNYGEIGLLFIDGWSWKMGHEEVPYDEIYALVKSLQPNCILIDNTHLPCLYHNDMLHFEAGGEIPTGNTFPSLLSLLIYTDGGNSWFWAEDIPTAPLMSTTSIVNTLNVLEPQWVTFVLNLPPNNDGLLDDNIVDRIKEVGENWSPDEYRAPLPKQPPQIIEPITPISATASSGNASYLIDGFNDRFKYTVWESSGTFPQTITIDLGQVYTDVSILSYVPKYVPKPIRAKEEGSIKDFILFTSKDNMNYDTIVESAWNGDKTMKTVVFKPTEARYLKLEIKSGVDNFAAATEIAIGKGDYYDYEIVNSNSSYNINDNRVMVYPNPASERISIPDYQDFLNYEIYNSVGKIVAKDIVSEHIDIKYLEKGTYVIKLNNLNGKTYMNKIIII